MNDSLTCNKTIFLFIFLIEVSTGRGFGEEECYNAHHIRSHGGSVYQHAHPPHGRSASQAHCAGPIPQGIQWYI